MENKSATKDEYNEYQKILRIKSNINKVKNILELRDEIDKEIELAKGEIERIETIKKANEKEILNSENMDKILAEISEVEKDLKNPNLDEKEKEELELKHKDLIEKKDKNNNNYRKIQKVFEQNAKPKTDKFKTMSIEDLNKKVFDLSSKRSKCSMVCNNLMKGLSWDSIEVKLDNWQSKRYTSKEKITSKAKNTPEATIDINELGKKIIKQTEEQIKNGLRSEETGIGDIKKEPKVEKEDKKEDTELVVVSEFDKKHPRLAKIKNWFKNKFKNISKKEVNSAEELENIEKEQNALKEDNEFKQYLKEVVEKRIRWNKKRKNRTSKERNGTSKKTSI